MWHVFGVMKSILITYAIDYKSHSLEIDMMIVNRGPSVLSVLYILIFMRINAVAHWFIVQLKEKNEIKSQELQT